jgi:hypothetical protein
MGTQGDALAAKVQQTSEQLISMIQSCPDDKWSMKTSAEGWSVAVAAHHAAGGFGATSQLVGAIAKGMPVPPLTAEIIDAGNAKHAQDFVRCTKAETIDLARKESASAAALLRGLSDEELARTATLFFAGPDPIPAAKIAEFLVIGHPAGHMESMKATA